MFGNMYNNYGWGNGIGFGGMGMGLGLLGGVAFGFFMVIAIIWSLYWKYYALWHAAKNNEKGWFIALMVINTLGILEIAYLYYFSKKKE